MLGWIAIGEILKGVGALVALIGIGQMVAGYIYPNQSEEINKVVEEFEKNKNKVWEEIIINLKIILKNLEELLA